MILVLPRMVSRADRVRTHEPEIFGSDIVSYSTAFTTRGPGVPQLLLVEIPAPGSVLRAHYHASDQFQLIIEGGGQLGRHEILPVSLHYTNRYTGYGPILSGPEGLSYYVLRPTFDPLGYGQYLHHPELREKAKRHPGPKRSFMINGLPTASGSELSSMDQPSVKHLFGVAGQKPDAGLFADVLTMGPGGSFNCADPASGGGQVVFVLAGSLECQGESLPRTSTIALTRDEAPITIEAGGAGVQVLLMQYPRRLPDTSDA